MEGIKLAVRLNYSLPQVCDKDKILFYAEERAKYLGVKTKIIWAPSPSCLWASLMSSIRASIKSSYWSPLKPLLKSSVGPDFESLIRSSLDSFQRGSLRAALRTSLESLVRVTLRASLWSFLRESINSSFWSSVWPFYEFLYGYKYYALNEDISAKNYFMYLPEAFKAGLGFAVITDREFYAVPMPKYSLNRENKLHRDLGPAVIWADGTKDYYLNGVKVPRKVAETPAEELHPQILLKERNAEVRREILRKIGVERACYLLNAKVIDKRGDYELLLLDLQDGRSRPYLKMKNPSLGTYHIEGIPPGRKTVQEALTWRNQTEEDPVMLA